MRARVRRARRRLAARDRARDGGPQRDVHRARAAREARGENGEQARDVALGRHALARVGVEQELARRERHVHERDRAAALEQRDEALAPPRVARDEGLELIGGRAAVREEVVQRDERQLPVLDLPVHPEPRVLPRADVVERPRGRAERVVVVDVLEKVDDGVEVGEEPVEEVGRAVLEQVRANEAAAADQDELGLARELGRGGELRVHLSRAGFSRFWISFAKS